MLCKHVVGMLLACCGGMLLLHCTMIRGLKLVLIVTYLPS